MKNEILVFDHAQSLSEAMLDMLEQEGYNAEESLPALMLAVVDLVLDTVHPSQALDEAINMCVERYEAVTSYELGIEPEEVTDGMD